jgi:hypothetical protein
VVSFETTVYDNGKPYTLFYWAGPTLLKPVGQLVKLRAGCLTGALGGLDNPPQDGILPHLLERQVAGFGGGVDHNCLAVAHGALEQQAAQRGFDFLLNGAL